MKKDKKVNLEEESQTKEGRIWITYLMIFCFIFSLVCVYNIGKDHGLIQGVFHGMKFEEVCSYGKHTNWINDTCYMGNFTKNQYQFNKNLIVTGNESKLAEKIDILVITGIWMKEKGE